jgi:dephospho-CoA kinase
VLVVDCDPAIQLRRLMLRDRIDEAAARRMIEAQIPREARLALADDVIHNEGDVSMVASQVEALHKAYQRPQGYAK